MTTRTTIQLQPSLPPPPPPAFDFSTLHNATETTPEAPQNVCEPEVESEPLGEIDALQKKEEKPIKSNRLNRLLPEAAKIFQEITAEATIKNAISISNIEKLLMN